MAGLNKEQIEQLKQVLLDKSAELHALREVSAAARAPVSLDQQSVGRVSRIDAMQQQAMAQAQERQRASDLVRIEQAMVRVETEDFGYCAECDQAIAFRRMLIDPCVTLCIKCAGGGSLS